MKTPEDTVFPAADKHNTGVVIMNASRNDRLFGNADAPSPEQFYQYVLSHKSVDLTIMGLRDVERFHRVAEALSEQETLAAAGANRFGKVWGTAARRRCTDTVNPILKYPPSLAGFVTSLSVKHRSRWRGLMKIQKIIR